MTVEELIDMLRDHEPGDQVLAWDPDLGQYHPVSGCVFGGDDGTVTLQTDDIT